MIKEENKNDFSHCASCHLTHYQKECMCLPAGGGVVGRRLPGHGVAKLF